jgi:hypothetical protein
MPYYKHLLFIIQHYLIKFQNALQIPAIQLVNQPNVARKIRNDHNHIIVASAANWLAGLK